MEQITITREEFEKRIIDNPKGYGIVRMLRQHPEKAEGNRMRLVLEELTQIIVLHEIESELFGDEKQQAEEDLFDDQEEEEQPQVVSVTINLSKED